jgi:hypothetical protein
MAGPGRMILQQSELHELRARVIELESELGALRRDHDALVALVDRVVSVVRAERGDDDALVQAVERAAPDAISP